MRHNKNKFIVKCPIKWCRNRITCYDFHVGHNIPESKGGKTICSKCNLSMSNNYTINKFSKLFFIKWRT